MTAQLSPQTEALIARLLARFAPPARVPLTEWAETHRYLAQGTKRPGPYRVAATPYLRGIQEAVTYALTGIEPRHAPPGRPREIVVQKAAQVGYTEGVVLNTLGWAIDSLRVPAMGLFAKEAAAREFASDVGPTLVLSGWRGRRCRRLAAKALWIWSACRSWG